ncbi:MAG: RNA polymerase sigma factor [Bryobacteraceae bacterium]
MTATEIVEATLMKQTPEGDTTPFAEFFEQTRRKAYVFARHLVGDREEATDITQEAYLRLHARWGRHERDLPTTAWLYKVIRNLAIDHLRRRARRPEAEVDHATLSSPMAGPEATAEQREVAARLWEAIGNLPPEQREILLLRDWHGLDYAQIADLLGLSMGTVSSRLHHAREKVREQMRRFLG